jgi:hypothetical protein
LKFNERSPLETGDAYHVEPASICADLELPQPMQGMRFADRKEAGRVRMATNENDQIVEPPTEVRQAELGPSVFMLLAISTGLAVLILIGIWLVFFR